MPICRRTTPARNFWCPISCDRSGQAVLLTPLTGIALAGIARESSGAASGVFNMLRKLGGAFSTAILATIVTKREQFHSNVIGGDVTLFRDSVRERLNKLTAYFMSHGVSDPAAARREAIVALGNVVHKQATIMAYADTFAVLGALLLFTRRGQTSELACP
jgi:DHA2 family multidrug resistance protein